MLVEVTVDDTGRACRRARKKRSSRSSTRGDARIGDAGRRASAWRSAARSSRRTAADPGARTVRDGGARFSLHAAARHAAAPGRTRTCRRARDEPRRRHAVSCAIADRPPGRGRTADPPLRAHCARGRRLARLRGRDAASSGLIEAGTRKPDLVILDLGLPDGDGVDLIRDLRSWSTVPVIVLSARIDETDKIARARCRRRRLPDQAVRRRRTAGAGARAPAAAARRRARRRRRDVPLRRRRSRPGAPHRAASRARAVHLTPIEYRLLTLLVGQRRPGADAPPAAARGLGTVATSRATTTCASTWATCGRSSRTIPRSRATCSPRPASATASSREPDRSMATNTAIPRPQGHEALGVSRLADIDARRARRRLRRHRHQPALRAQGVLPRRSTASRVDARRTCSASSR